MSVPQSGTALMKLLVPSIGSSTQVNSASSRTLPISSPMMPCEGKRASMRRRSNSSAPRSAAVTGEASPLASTARSARPKKGRMKSPLSAASSAMKAR